MKQLIYNSVIIGSIITLFVFLISLKNKITYLEKEKGKINTDQCIYAYLLFVFALFLCIFIKLFCSIASLENKIKEMTSLINPAKIIKEKEEIKEDEKNM